MPLYAYRCIECQHEFEARQKITEEPLTECPECKEQVKRIITSANFVLKGEKWFKNSGQY